VAGISLVPGRNVVILSFGLILVIGAGWVPVHGHDVADPAKGHPRDLTELSMEELANLQVTSVSKQPQNLSQAPAAISVLTQEDIRHSGVTTIADALRLVPGLQVASSDAHTWAITSRGFNDIFANKLLVLMDGRSVYTPLFSGVYWDVQDTVMEDIDRIEVIRGPGATLWGANAVNGVINIITRSARETQGLLTTAGGGTEEQAFGSVRYGGKLGEHAWYRVSAKSFRHDDSVMPDGRNGQDAWWMTRAGMRVDWEPNPQDALTVLGDWYTGEVDQVYDITSLNPPYLFAQGDDSELTGCNLLGRWTRSYSDTASVELQAYYDRSSRFGPRVREARQTGDLEWQNRFSAGERNQVVWGFGYRGTGDRIDDGFMVEVNPRRRYTSLLNGFVQDKVTLVADRLKLTLGTKIERNSFTGFEVQPGARLLWTPHERHAVWASVARAARTPSRMEGDGRINVQVAPPGVFGPLPTAAAVVGRDGYRSEELIAYEAGYRFQPVKNLSLDLAVFYNDYDHLRSLEQGTNGIETIPAPVHAVSTVVVDNELTGETYGAELGATLQITDWWRVRGGYTYLQMQLHTRRKSSDTTSEGSEGQSPHHQFSIRSSISLPGHTEFDCGLRYVDSLPTPNIPAYLELDARVAWHPSDHWEIAIVGRNLLDKQHPEFSPSPLFNTQRTEVQRGVFGKITFRF
jgi:iron complex outermembrane receptor protein